MKYHVKKRGALTWSPLETESLIVDVELGRIRSDWRIRKEGESEDFSVEEYLRMAAQQKAGAAESTRRASARPAPDHSNPADAAITRYEDGYLVARTIEGIGSVIKGVGIVLGIIIAIVGLIVGTQTNLLFGIVGFIFGIAVAIPLFVVGVIVSALAQVIKATLDAAVHTSPFLDNQAKAAAMFIK
jgi:hypothetical protein